MWTLSGFVDEIDPDFDRQVEVATELGLTHIEFRSAWGTNVLDLSGTELDRVADTLADAGLKVSAIGSPIGKIGIEEDFGPHLDRMKHAAEVAHRLKAPYIRLFSFFLHGVSPEASRDDVLRRMDALAAVGASEGLVLLHENEKDIYGDIPQRCHDIVTSVDNDHLRLAWDAANFVQCGVRPFTDGYELLRPHTVYIQIKDALLADGHVVPAGQGDGEVAETMRALAADGFDGFFSLEPHLSAVGTFGGFSGPDLFTEAHRAFTGLLDAEGIPYA
ncbi:sugar phosphate isomerase/epimerase family protein [Ruania halotolerans]|uniref:sugar phosphate isomerase/epimerase family protein n=1 Tax=Ruania halotolerans TaxID=2897773 RepID=UPI001E2DCE89|nr:sugar phosphate isomerase/epimerase family protein [Ruania halotolerans]UFU04962.1 sugar phosphate isomerase/epimerase [Ruania halotolerans]